MYYRNEINDTYFQYYKIESGDTLYKIAKKYNVNPNLLANLNGLDIDDYIYPNQIVLIPNNNYSYYITKDGDTLDEVAKTLNVEPSKVIKDNKSIYLLEGQMIIKKKI